MDESEALIARAALAPPEEALEAWKTWRATQSIAQASALLTWAGGYINRNLREAGIDDPYLAGIHRHNWIANNRRVSIVLPTIHRLTERWSITPLKSFGMSGDHYSRGLRPLADFDFYVDEVYASEVKLFLQSEALAPLMNISTEEFARRIVKQRGSWNFTNAAGADLDLHWRAFDHLDAAKNEALVQANSEIVDSEFGPIRRLTNELMLISLANHHVLQSPPTLNGLFDFYYLLKGSKIARAATLAAEVGISKEIAQMCDVLAGLAGAAADPALAELSRAVRADAAAQPAPGLTRVASRLGERLDPARVEPFYLKSPRLYLLWWWIGRPLWLERAMIRVFGGVARVRPRPGDISTAELLPPSGGYPATGWHYPYPGNAFRWANVPDTRIVFENSSTASRLHITFDEPFWKIAPVQAIDVFCNGRLLGVADRSNHEFEFALPQHGGRVEISLRQKSQERFVNPGVHLNWHRMLAPVRSIELVERAGTVERAGAER